MDGLDDKHRLEAIIGMLRDQRDLEPLEVTAHLRLYRLIHQLQESDELTPLVVDAVVGEGTAIVPLLAGVLRAYARTSLFDDDTPPVENALALMGEIGSPEALPHLLEFGALDDANLARVSRWGIHRLIELDPAGAAAAIHATASGLDSPSRLVLAERLLFWPRWAETPKLLEKLAENAKSLRAEERGSLFPMLLAIMITSQGRVGLELARRTLRRNASLMDRRTRRECEETINVAVAMGCTPPYAPEEAVWTVYQICAGEAVWPDDEDDEDYDDDAAFAPDEDLFVEPRPRLGPMTRELPAPTPMPAPEKRASTRGRNDPCWCGSGKKYKKCHLDADAQPVPAPAPGWGTPGEFGHL